MKTNLLLALAVCLAGCNKSDEPVAPPVSPYAFTVATSHADGRLEGNQMTETPSFTIELTSGEDVSYVLTYKVDKNAEKTVNNFWLGHENRVTELDIPKSVGPHTLSGTVVRKDGLGEKINISETLTVKSPAITECYSQWDVEKTKGVMDGSVVNMYLGQIIHFGIMYEPWDMSPRPYFSYSIENINLFYNDEEIQGFSELDMGMAFGSYKAIAAGDATVTVVLSDGEKTYEFVSKVHIYPQPKVEYVWQDIYTSEITTQKTYTYETVVLSIRNYTNKMTVSAKSGITLLDRNVYPEVYQGLQEGEFAFSLDKPGQESVVSVTVDGFTQDIRLADRVNVLTWNLDDVASTIYNLHRFSYQRSIRREYRIPFECEESVYRLTAVCEAPTKAELYQITVGGSSAGEFSQVWAETQYRGNVSGLSIPVRVQFGQMSSLAFTIYKIEY